MYLCIQLLFALWWLILLKELSQYVEYGSAFFVGGTKWLRSAERTSESFVLFKHTFIEFPKLYNVELWKMDSRL